MAGTGKSLKPRPKVLAAFLTTVAAAAIVAGANLIGVDIPQEVALGLAGGAITALLGGWLKTEKPTP